MIEKKYTDLIGKAPDRIYLTGEFRATPGRLEYNFISGTYMAKKFENFKSMSVDTRPIEEKFNNALSEYFPKMDIVHTPDTPDKSFIPSIQNKIFTEKEWIYAQDLFGPYLQPIEKFSIFHNDCMTQGQMTRMQGENKKMQEEERKKQQDRMNNLSSHSAFLQRFGKK